jgi:diphthamide synthase subunit DPH2
VKKVTDDDAERLRRRVGALTPQARAAVEKALRARAEHLRAARHARAIAELTPTQARQHRAEIAAEIRRRLATGQIAHPETRKRLDMAATNLEQRLI